MNTCESTPSTVPDPDSENRAGPLHVVAAVLRDDAGRVLLARRPDHKHQGGLWEFPGGKLHAGEARFEGLRRELAEELGIVAARGRPLIRVRHRYPDLDVLLDTWEVTEFSGEPAGLEGQQLSWVEPGDLFDYEFPAANLPILGAVRLPDRYFVTPDVNSVDALRAAVRQALGRGVRLVQYRAPGLSGKSWDDGAEAVLGLCRSVGADLMVNGAVEVAAGRPGVGLHLSSRRLATLDRRPVGRDRLLGASCHDLAELERAAQLGVDFVTLSPVRQTATHPDAEPLGWARFAELVRACPVPVFAMGGMEEADLSRAREAGAQGIAGISGFLSGT